MEDIISGIKTCYYKEGQGNRNLVFLHGWGTDYTNFLPIFEMIKDRYTIYALDLPGFGETEEPEKVYDLRDYAGFVKEFILKMKIQDPVMIGHSNGGRVSIALTQILKIDKMILIDSAGIKPKRSLRYYFKVYTYKFIKKTLILIGGKDGALVKKYSKNKGSADYRIASNKMKAVMKNLVNEDIRKYLPEVSASTLLFWGENDTYTPLSDAKVMNRLIKDSGIVTVKNAGHFSFLEDKRLFVKVLDKFLEE